MCSKLALKTPGVFIVNFEHISHPFLVSIADFEQVNVSWEDGTAVTISVLEKCFLKKSIVD